MEACLWVLQTKMDGEVLQEHSSSYEFGSYWLFWIVDVKPLCVEFAHSMYRSKDRDNANRQRAAIAAVFRNALAESRHPAALLYSMSLYVESMLHKCTRECMTMGERLAHGSAEKAAVAYEKRIGYESFRTIVC